MADANRPSAARPAAGASLVSALLLVLLVAALNLWLNRHFGIGLDSPGELVPALGAIGLAWGLVGRLVGKDDLDEVSQRTRTTVRRFLLSPAMIVVLWAAFAVAVLLWSSVTVVAESGAEGLTVSLSPLNSGSAAEPVGAGVAGDDSGAAATGREVRRKSGKGVVRFGVTTSALAGPYLVRADGYQGAIAEASPLLGARVVLGTDVARAPALLIRPDEALLERLRAGGRLEVYRRRGGHVDSLALVVGPTAGSFLVGRRHIPLSGRAAEWERELLAAGVTDSQLRNRHIIDWRRPLALDASGQLAAGDTVIVRVVALSTSVSGSEEIVLGGEEVSDLFLRRIPEDAP